MTFESETAATAETPPELGASEDADEDWGGDDWGDESTADAGIALNPIDQTISLLSVRRTTGSEAASR